MRAVACVLSSGSSTHSHVCVCMRSLARARVTACLCSVKLLDRSRSLYSRVSPPAGSGVEPGGILETYTGAPRRRSTRVTRSSRPTIDPTTAFRQSRDWREEVCGEEKKKNFREPRLCVSRIFPEEKFCLQCARMVNQLSDEALACARARARSSCKLRFGSLWSLNFTSLTHKIRRLILRLMTIITFMSRVLCTRTAVVRENANFNICRYSAIRSFFFFYIYRIILFSCSLSHSAHIGDNGCAIPTSLHALS